MQLPTTSVLDSASLAGAQAAHNLAVILLTGWKQVWDRDPETVAAELNADVAKSVGIFTLNAQAGSAVNELLDSVNDERFPTRAILTMPPGWALTETGFYYTAPVIEEPDKTPLDP